MEIIKRYIQRNYTKGRVYGGKIFSPKRIIIHTYGAKGRSLFDWFNKPNSNASAHYAVFKDGTIEQYVDERDTAWHGASSKYPINNYDTIGIEHQDDGYSHDYVRTNELYASSAKLVAQICKQYGIPCNSKYIEPHKKYADDGRTCPGGLDINRIIKEANNILSINNSVMNDYQTISEIFRKMLGKMPASTAEVNFWINVANTSGWRYAIQELLKANADFDLWRSTVQAARNSLNKF